MLKLSTKGRYGTRFMIELASRYGRGFILLRDIAECQDISNGYLEQILPYLRRAGLVRARRGACGGYCLARPPSKITLGEIVRALEGDLTVVDCVSAETVCPKARDCKSRNVWVAISKKIVAVLDAFSLQDVIHSRMRGKSKTGNKTENRKKGGTKWARKKY